MQPQGHKVDKQAEFGDASSVRKRCKLPLKAINTRRSNLGYLARLSLSGLRYHETHLTLTVPYALP